MFVEFSGFELVSVAVVDISMQLILSVGVGADNANKVFVVNVVFHIVVMLNYGAMIFVNLLDVDDAGTDESMRFWGYFLLDFDRKTGRLSGNAKVIHGIDRARANNDCFWSRVQR